MDSENQYNFDEGINIDSVNDNGNNDINQENSPNSLNENIPDESIPVNNNEEFSDEKEEKLIKIVSSEIDNYEPENKSSSIEESKTPEDKQQSTNKPPDSSIAAQFNKIVRARKTTVPRCRRTAMPNKITPRYMTQPVMSENQGSIDSLRDTSCVDDEGGSSVSVQDSTSTSTLDKRNFGEQSNEHKMLSNKYSRTLSGTTKTKRELTDTIEPSNSFNSNLLKKENSTDQDNKSDRSMGSNEFSNSPEGINSAFFDESKLAIQRSPSKMEKIQNETNRSNQNSLPGSLRRNIPQHIRIHSDEIKPNADPIADVTTEYLSRKISKVDKKEMDFPFSNTPMGSRISPFRYNFESSPFDNAVLKSPSAQALMRSSINKSRSIAQKGSLQMHDSDNKKMDNDDIEESNIPEISNEIINDKQDDQQNFQDSEDKYSDKKQKLEKRYLIIQELIYVESEYVKVLEILVNHYMIPLKLEKIIDDVQVDSIFNKIQELLNYHSIFLGTLQSIEFDETVGDKISQMFSKQSVQDCYTSFIENFTVSEKVLENSLNSKSSLQKFVELKQKESKNKLPLKALMVQPVQRIPRYELLIKRLIEYTPLDSIDYEYLIDAQSAVHQLAIKINAVKESKQDESINEGLKFLDRLLSPMTITQNRQFIRHDLVSFEDRKEPYVVFLFSDQIILTSVKRRGVQAAKKPLVLRFVTPNGIDFIDNVKYKFVMRINIENIEFEMNEDADQKILLRNKEMKDKKDLNILEEIELLASKMDRKHHEIDSCIKKLYTSILQDMEDSKNSRTIPNINNSAACQFLVTTKEGIEKMELAFNSVEKKHSWERTVVELKIKLVDIPRTPKFNQALSITRTQSGMQFCCACPIEGYNNSGIRDIWICQTDGFTGHLCLLSMQTDPIVIMNSPIPSCNSKVVSIIAVPGFTGSTRRSSLGFDNRFTALSQLKKKSKDSSQLFIPIETKEDDTETDIDGMNIKNTQDESSSQSCSESGEEDIEEDQSEEPVKAKKMSDPYKATMWIGLEDGSILIFYSAENVRTTKSKKKIDLGSPVLSMLYFDNHVYISLQNGEIITFKRHLEGNWDFEYPNIAKLVSHNAPIKNLTAVTGFIWGTSNRSITIINPTSIKIENTFALTNGTDQRPISLIACSGQCVWIAQENSARVMLYHANSYEFLYEINMRSSIMQHLQVWDDIIIRHKEACLRITSLLVCKDLLWVGTSAGLVLTILIPNVTTSTTKSNLFQPRVEALDRGHTGPVRFLVGLESSVRSSYPSSRRQSLSPCTTMATQMKVICGGDGLEDFANKNVKEVNSDVGKDDATSYILIWDIQ